MLGFLDSYGGKERADTDSCCAQVVYLVDLQAGVYLAGACQDIIYVVTASRPQPNELSWIKSRSSRVFTKLAAEYSLVWYIH